MQPMENTDGPPNSMEVLSPTEPMPVAITEAKSPVKVTESDAIAAARVLGLKTVRIKRLASSAVIGQFMAQLGATRIGQGMLLVAEKEIGKGLRLCDRFMRDYPHEPEVLASIMKIRLGLVDAMLKAAHTHIKVNKDSGAVELEMKPQNQAFPANAAVSQAVQINFVAKPETQP